MKIRPLLAAICAVSVLGSSVHAAPPANLTEAIQQLNADAALLSGWTGHEFARAMPFNSTAGNVVPSQLKVLGITFGANVVVTGTDVDEGALHNLGTSLVDTNSIDTIDPLAVPMILGYAKIGLPWGLDAGLRFGGIPSEDFEEGDSRIEVANSVFGLDLRKVLIEEGAVKPFGLTAGLSFTRANGHVTATTDQQTSLAGSGVTLTNAITTARSDWDTNSVGAQIVINKKILFINPYLGVGADKYFGDVDTSITNTGSITHDASAQTQSLEGTGGVAHESIDEWDFRGMAGLEITFFPFFKMGIGGEIASANKWAGNLGLRFQFR